MSFVAGVSGQHSRLRQVGVPNPPAPSEAAEFVGPIAWPTARGGDTWGDRAATPNEIQTSEPQA